MGTPFADNYPEMIRLCLDAFDQVGVFHIQPRDQAYFVCHVFASD